MQIAVSTKLVDLFRDMAEKEEAVVVNLAGESILTAGLNVRDKPWLVPYVVPMAEHMFAKVAASGIDYDAVVSIPSGGNSWAYALAEIASTHAGREIPSFSLKKVGEKEFKIKDEQPPVGPGAKLLLVDDTLYTGVAAHRATTMLTTAGYQISGSIFPVEIGPYGRGKLEALGCAVLSVFNDGFLAQMSQS